MSRRHSAARRLWRKYSTGVLFLAALGAVLIMGLAVSEAAAPLASPPVVLHLQGNVSDHNGDPTTACTGVGAADIIKCGGPFLSTNATLDAGPAAQWAIASPALDRTGPRTIYDPSWVWQSGPVRLGGNMMLQWWGAAGASGGGVFSANWTIRLWADGVKAFEEVVVATSELPNILSKLVHDARVHYSRVVEVEAFGCPAQ